MTRTTPTILKIWRYGGMFLFVALTMDRGIIWMGIGAAIYALVYGALIYAIPAPSAEDEARKNVEWFALIDQDYKKVRSIEDHLDELERLKRRDMVTPEEYTAKRQEILKDL
jgi:hypothetical protein